MDDGSCPNTPFVARSVTRISCGRVPTRKFCWLCFCFCFVFPVNSTSRLSPSVSKFAPNDNDENNNSNSSNNSNNKAKMAPTRWNQEATQDLLVSIFVVMRSGMKPDVQASIVEEMKSRGHDDISWEPLRYGRALFCISLSCHGHVRPPLFLSCLQVLGGEYSEKSRFVSSDLLFQWAVRRGALFRSSCLCSFSRSLQLLPNHLRTFFQVTPPINFNTSTTTSINHGKVGGSPR